MRYVYVHVFSSIGHFKRRPFLLTLLWSDSLTSLSSSVLLAKEDLTLLRFWHSIPSHPQQACLPQPAWDLTVNVASPSRPAGPPSSPLLLFWRAMQHSCSPLSSCLPTLMASQLHHSEGGTWKGKESVRKEGMFSIFSGGQTCVLLLHSYVCRLPSG